MLKKADLKKDFEIFKGKTLGILLFGSYAIGEETGASDIDVCLVKPQNDTVLRDVSKSLGGKYDIKVFEQLPLYIQIDIIQNHVIIYGDKTELSAYFYKFRRLWKDMAFRVDYNRFSSVEERMAHRKRWLHAKREILGEIGSI